MLQLVECSRSFVHLNTAPSTALVRRRHAADKDDDSTLRQQSIHEDFTARPGELRRYCTLRQLHWHSAYSYDVGRKEHPWVARREAAVITVCRRACRRGPWRVGPS